ncbi:MAG: glutamate synthase-related protein [Methermicoccaceae archaeon]
MDDSRANSRSASGTTTRYKDVNPISGMCPICVRECTVLCEIGKSALRGREVLYPVPEQFGESTASANKDFGLDWSHFQILTELIGAEGIEPDSDVAVFPNADVSTTAGGVPLKVPCLIAGLGSTAVAKNYWDGLAVGAALAGTIVTVGENVCGMDVESSYTSGKVQNSPDMQFRVNTFREYWDGVHGEVAVQTNVEDERGGVDEYVLSKLEVNIVERKWGQGAKAIGGEVRLNTIEKAQTLKRRGYVVIPDPDDPEVQDAHKNGVFKTFERHSRVGFPEMESFVEGVEKLREQGAEKVFLKTGAYRPASTAFALRCASEAKIDMLTFDGAGGGTGMSPVPMMNECSTPTVYLEAQVLKGVELLKGKGRHVPDISIAGGITNETQLYKAIALSNFGEGPAVKAVAQARAPLTAVFKADYFTQLSKDKKLPASFVSTYGDEPGRFMVAYSELHEKFGDEVYKIPAGAIGLYTYWTDRIAVGLQQLMAGARKFKIENLSRDDLASLTPLATEVTDIPMLHHLETEKFEGILLG